MFAHVNQCWMGVGCLYLSVCLFLCPLSILFCPEHQIHTICSQWTKHGMIATPDPKLCIFNFFGTQPIPTHPKWPPVFYFVWSIKSTLFGPGEPNLAKWVTPDPKLCILKFFGTRHNSNPSKMAAEILIMSSKSTNHLCLL